MCSVCLPHNSVNVVVCLHVGVSQVGTAAARFYHMLSAASATGEYEKVCHGEHHCQCVFSSSVWCAEQLLHASSLSYSAIYIGLFENYLNIRFKDPNFEAVSPSITRKYLYTCQTCYVYLYLVAGVCWSGLGGVP